MMYQAAICGMCFCVSPGARLEIYDDAVGLGVFRCRADILGTNNIYIVKTHLSIMWSGNRLVNQSAQFLNHSVVNEPVPLSADRDPGSLT